MNLELLLAKDAIFRLIGQFHRATKFDDGELYIYNYDEDKVYYYPAMIDGDVIYKNDIFELNISSDSVKSGTKNKLLRKNIDDLNRLK